MDLLNRELRQQTSDLVEEVRALRAELATRFEAQQDGFKSETSALREELSRLIEGIQSGADLRSQLEADADGARRDATLALQSLTMREADLADLRRRQAELLQENARLSMLLSRSKAGPLQPGTDGDARSETASPTEGASPARGDAFALDGASGRHESDDS